ncbi:MAG: hypothetical protein Q4G09_05935 [Clostridia bacterium]|nr:hypothetical protein [Clostridia bacterium]
MNKVCIIFILGFNHDIGYECGNNYSHNEIGGETLRKEFKK